MLFIIVKLLVFPECLKYHNACLLYTSLAQLEYSSKIEIEGQVRIVAVPGYDVCACCAPHVKRTGEIGMLKVMNYQNYKGGVRISIPVSYTHLFFEYAKVGLPILIAGILYFAFIGYKCLPEKQGSTESSYDEQKDFSNVPKWKQMMSLIILILTLLGMIFERCV